MLNSEEIKAVAIAVIGLCLSEGISKGVSESVSQSVGWLVSHLTALKKIKNL